MDVGESSGFQLEGHDVGEYTNCSGKTQRALIKKVNALISQSVVSDWRRCCIPNCGWFCSAPSSDSFES